MIRFQEKSGGLSNDLIRTDLDKNDAKFSTNGLENTVKIFSAKNSSFC